MVPAPMAASPPAKGGSGVVERPELRAERALARP
jgi:hypothetical protein